LSEQLPELLQTERMVLRAPTDADAAVLFERYTQDPEVARYTVWRPHSEFSETRDFVAACMRDWQGGRCRAYMLELPDGSGEPIGVLEARLGLTGTPAHQADVGYWLGRRWWGQGLMPEALRALVAAILALPTVLRIQATCDVDNRASVRVLEKSGFVREGRMERHTLHPNISSEPRACFLYARCR
jgi:RimJ/RimL family protein N-acetyltransferase